MQQISATSNSQVQAFFNRVYNWMGAGLVLTAVVAWFTASNPAALMFVAQNFIILFLLQLGLVWGIGLLLPRISSTVAAGMFMLYAFTLGLTLSGILLVYTGESIASVFVVSAGMFIGLSLYGHTTKSDLGPVGRMAVMALIGLLLTMIVNIFLRSDLMAYIISVIGVVIFAALTAHDTQKLKNMALVGFENGESAEKLAVYGALTLYLDFINLFLFLLRLFGGRK